MPLCLPQGTRRPSVTVWTEVSTGTELHWTSVACTFREVILALPSALVRAQQQCWAQLPTMRDGDTGKEVQHSASNGIRDLEHLLSEERLRKLELQPGEGKTQGNSSVCRNTWRAGLKRRETDFSVVPFDRPRDNEHKLNHRTSYLNIKRYLNTVKVRKHWCRVPTEAVELHPWRYLRPYWTWTWTIYLKWPFLSSCVGLDNPWKPLLT